MTQIVQHSSTHHRWYTPAWLCDAARAFLQGIDLDPASSDEANARVGATRIYTVADDGLTLPWTGTIWCNPPYGYISSGDGRVSGSLAFVRKAIAERQAGRAREVLMLMKAAHATQWARLCAQHATARCFFSERVDYEDGTGAAHKSTAPHESMLVYFGPRRAAFELAFEAYGEVV